MSDVPPPVVTSWSRVDWAIGICFAVFLVAVGVLLFSQGQSALLFNDAAQSESLVREEGTLTIAYDQPLITYESTAPGVIQRQYLANVFEGLVRFDRDFNLEPALALSWGMLDDTTWQFQLRPEVVFHNGSPFTVEDVIESFERAASHPESGIQHLVGTILEAEAVDENTLRITTEEPDPTLLQKLTMVPIVPSAVADTMIIPIGTGPYSFVRQENEEEWHFERFEDYWGDPPSYPALVLRSIPDKFLRYEAFVRGEIDVLAQVPPVFVDALLTMGYPVASLPTLEVAFLLFDTEDNDSPFRHDALRQAIRHVLNGEELADLASGYAHPISQFVSRGVFGYNPAILFSDIDIDAAREQVASYADRVTLSLDLPDGLEALGTILEDQLFSLGLPVTVTYWSDEEYATLIANRESDFFFLAWRSELGDAGEFFEAIVHSPSKDERYGRLHASATGQASLDARIEAMNRNVLQSLRLDELQALMQTLVEEEVIGIPLFESDTLVAIQKDLEGWEPRMDNLLLAMDFK